MPEFRFVWLRALAHAVGPHNRPVSAVDVASALEQVARVRGRVTGRAAAASLARLARRGLAEVVVEGDRRRWLVTTAGIAALTDPVRASDASGSPVPSASRVFDTPELRRLSDMMAAYNRGDLAEIDRVIANDVLLFVPGLSSIAGTYAGHGQVIRFLDESSRRVLPAIDVIEGFEQEGEVLIRVRAVVRGGDVERLELWVRARVDAIGHVAQVVLQPEDQAAFDGAVGRGRP